jgi:hypothetical protein
MFYIIMACITMFISSVFVFVYNRNTKVMREESLVFGLFAAFLASMVWFVTIPAIIVIGSAYLVSKLFTLDWKSKNESNKNN